MVVEYCLWLQLLLNKDLQAVLALSAVCSNSRVSLATALLQIFRHERQEAHLINTLNEKEIEREGTLQMSSI